MRNVKFGPNPFTFKWEANQKTRGFFVVDGFVVEREFEQFTRLTQEGKKRADPEKVSVDEDQLCQFVKSLLSDGELLPACGSLVDSIVQDDSYHYVKKLKEAVSSQVVVVNGFRYAKQLTVFKSEQESVEFVFVPVNSGVIVGGVEQFKQIL